MKSLLGMLIAIVVSAGVFILFVPDAVFPSIPPGGTKWEKLALHSVLFALLNHLVLRVVHAVLRAL